MAIKTEQALGFTCEKCNTFQYCAYTLEATTYEGRPVMSDNIDCKECGYTNHVIEERHADMTEAFNQGRESFLNWFLVASLADGPITEKMQEYPRIVTMQINGEEVDPNRSLKRLEDMYDEQIERAARERLESWQHDIMDPFKDKVDELTEGLERMLSDKLPAVEKA